MKAGGLEAYHRRKKAAEAERDARVARELQEEEYAQEENTKGKKQKGQQVQVAPPPWPPSTEAEQLTGG